MVVLIVLLVCLYKFIQCAVSVIFKVQSPLWAIAIEELQVEQFSDVPAPSILQSRRHCNFARYRRFAVPINIVITVITLLDRHGL